MGFIRALVGSLKGELEDQFLEYFYCNSLTNDILLAKGIKKSSKHSFNKGDPDVISNGSGIVVNDGQCAILVSNGKIVDVCAEPGTYTFDEGAEPSFFTGDLSEGIHKSIERFGERFIHGGQVPANQRIYYINTKEIMDNKFGTSNPLPFRIIDSRTGIDFDISVRCYGTYSFKITDPVLFYENIAGNTPVCFSKANIIDQLRAEMLDAMIPAFQKIGALGVRYSEITAHTSELKDAIMEALDEKWIGTRGIYMTGLSFGSLDIPKEDLDRIKEIQYDAVYTNQSMLGAKLGVAQAEAMKAAASNSSAGPMMAFAGMNMANNMGQSTNYASMVNSGQAPAAPASNAGNWTCSCGTVNTGKFCSECGKPNPNGPWTCPKCGNKNTGKFCSECGSPRA